ncbi:hypothetical protein LWI29_030601 [Acer saccharum]|uniref:Uncharacterized protein n=1 Tax=Acer saccharum TaxID=4024 RepID=A0AA39SVQ0_ACESA|nr:hypothetical protein LWI29_030601 [Acer saccharum]
MDGSKENGDNVFDMDTDVHVQTVFEGEMDKNNVSTAVHLEKVEGGNNEFSDKVEGDNEISEKADGDTEIVHAEVGNTSVSAGLSKDPGYKNILDEDEIEIINSACLANDMLSNDVEKADPQKLDLEKLVKQPLLVDEYPSPAANVVVPNSNMSVVVLDGPDPDVVYKHIDKVRARKRSRNVRSPGTNPMPMRKKKKPNGLDESSNNIEFMAFMKGKDQAR